LDLLLLYLLFLFYFSGKFEIDFLPRLCERKRTPHRNFGLGGPPPDAKNLKDLFLRPDEKNA